MDKNKIFLINRGELEGRFDCDFYVVSQDIELKQFVLKSFPKLKSYIKKIGTGYNNLQNNEQFGVPFLRTQNIRPINLELEQSSYTDDERIRIVRKGNILFTRIGAGVGTVACVHDGEFAISDNIIFISLDDEILPKYLAIFLSSKFGEYLLNKEKRDTARAIISYENIYNLKVPIFSKNIQQNIIDIMDKAYESKKQKEKEAQDLLDGIDDYLFDKLGIKLPNEPENNIENRTFKVGFDDIFADRLDADSYTSYYQNIFEAFEKSSCKFTTLKTITKKIKTGTTPDQKVDAFTIEKEIPFLRNSDIQNGEIIEDKFKYIKNDLDKHLTFSYKNEIIICIAGTIGISALNRFDRLAINQNVSSLTIDETQININFLIYWLNTKVAINLLKRLASIATIAYVNNPTLLRLQIPLPDITIQNEIANEIKQKRQKAKQLQNEAKEELENAKKEVEKIILGDNYEC